MKAAFILMCFLTDPLQYSGDLKFANVNNCNYFKKRLHGQVMQLGDQVRKYECMCKATLVNKGTRLF